MLPFLFHLVMYIWLQSSWTIYSELCVCPTVTEQVTIRLKKINMYLVSEFHYIRKKKKKTFTPLKVISGEYRKTFKTFCSKKIWGSLNKKHQASLAFCHTAIQLFDQNYLKTVFWIIYIIHKTTVEWLPEQSNWY